MQTLPAQPSESSYRVAEHTQLELAKDNISMYIYTAANTLREKHASLSNNIHSSKK